MFTSWTQTGHKDKPPGSICFDSEEDGLLTMKLLLDYHNGLYYYPPYIMTVAPSDSEQPIRVLRSNELVASCAACDAPVSILRQTSKYSPTSKDKQLEFKLGLLRLGSLCVSQLDRLPGNATGLLSVF
jgi:hypothetical protein